MNEREIVISERDVIIQELSSYCCEKSMIFKKLNAVCHIIRNEIIELLTSFFTIDNNVITEF